MRRQNRTRLFFFERSEIRTRGVVRRQVDFFAQMQDSFDLLPGLEVAQHYRIDGNRRPARSEQADRRDRGFGR